MFEMRNRTGFVTDEECRCINEMRIGHGFDFAKTSRRGYIRKHWNFRRATVFTLLLCILRLSHAKIDTNDNSRILQTLIRTASPTVGPTPNPTHQPTLYPTPEPTHQPTPMPTESPTSGPTFSPTGSPTFEPTDSPTPEPTEEPSMVPSRNPTSVPSNQPTPTPSNLPSAVPSLQPSYSPTSMPSQRPSASPSLRPSSTPSEYPTSQPSISFMPSAVPSTIPSRIPSSFPSTHPSRQPSSSPSTSPSSIPSGSPTLSLQDFLVEVVLRFDSCQTLRGGSIILFERKTAEQIEREIREVATDQLVVLDVGTNIREQIEILPTSSPTAAGGARRLGKRKDARGLQIVQLNPLEIVFDVAVNLRSPSYDHDVETYIGGAFDSATDRVEYISSLQKTGDRIFNTINEVIVEINGVPQVESSPPTSAPRPSGGANMVIYAAAGVAVVVASIIGFVFFVWLKTSHKHAPSMGDNNTQAPSESQGRVSTFIEVEPMDEVSTLGDPMYAPGAMFTAPMEKDDTAAGSMISGDYDYTREYGAAERTPSGGLETSFSSQSESARTSTDNMSSQLDSGRLESNSLFSDDASFEQQYKNVEERIEVTAPPGKLGVVIDTPNGGMPVVHAIKDTSVLASHVRVGDLLVAVDGEDTTTYSAIQVSKLISAKSNKPARALVFVRTRPADR